ncbi:hypothetical protein ACE1OE_02350 [Vibrio sp. E150_011]
MLGRWLGLVLFMVVGVGVAAASEEVAMMPRGFDGGSIAVEFEGVSPLMEYGRSRNQSRGGFASFVSSGYGELRIDGVHEFSPSVDYLRSFDLSNGTFSDSVLNGHVSPGENERTGITPIIVVTGGGDGVKRGGDGTGRKLTSLPECDNLPPKCTSLSLLPECNCLND